MAESYTDRQWEKWGNRNPYQGVLGVEDSTINLADNLRAFQKSGEEHIAARMADVGRIFPGWKPQGVALDFGCGVGRLALPLAGYFDRVIGIDISEGMLERARAHAHEKGITNAQFVRTVREAAAIDGGFDFVNSWIVLQHIRPHQGLEIIREMVRALRPGGVFTLHVVLADNKPGRRFLNFFRYRFPPLQWAYALSKGRPWNELVTEMNPYPIWGLLEVFSESVPEVVVAPFVQPGNYGSCVVYGRKASAGPAKTP